MTPSSRNRRSIRLPGYDYTQPGAYFITICTYQFVHLFGTVVNGKMEINEYGRIIEAEWHKSPQIRPYLRMDEFVVMPNHSHGIIWITNPELSKAKTLVQPEFRLKSRSLGAFVGGFKAAVTKQINLLRNAPSAMPVWHRNYYEHIIRRDESLNAIRQYIRENPARWQIDRYHPTSAGPDPLAIEIWQMLRDEEVSDNGEYL